jgi:cytochrome b6-f complex iron-sulfur subunit/menaquinol-cytochrome c reductase iron-sulfur subunit
MSDSETSQQPSDSPTPSGDDDSKPAASTAASAPEPPRRGALKALAVVGGCAYAGALAVPSLPFLTSSPEGKESSGGDGNWLRVAKLDALKEGKPERVKLKGDQRDAFTVTKDQTIGSVWLTRSGDAVSALSAECPHLGCAIDLRPGGESFSCPCHTSDFTLDGKPHKGPSPRPMDELTTRVSDDGWVEVDFRRFRQGTAQKVEV